MCAYVCKNKTKIMVYQAIYTYNSINMEHVQAERIKERYVDMYILCNVQDNLLRFYGISFDVFLFF